MTVTVTVTVTDSAGLSASGAFQVAVSDPAVVRAEGPGRGQTGHRLAHRLATRSDDVGQILVPKRKVDQPATAPRPKGGPPVNLGQREQPANEPRPPTIAAASGVHRRRRVPRHPVALR